MKILVAEDNARKLEHVISHVTSHFANLGVAIDIDTRGSYSSSLRAVVEDPPDLLVLDMTMPTYDVVVGVESGGRPRSFAGRDLVWEMRRRQIEIRFIVLTGFDVIGEGSEQCSIEEMSREIEMLCGRWFLGTVYYAHPDSSWKAELANLLDVALREVYA